MRGEGVGGVAEPAALHTHTHLPKAQGSTKWVGRVALITRKENHNQGECMGVATPDVFLGGEYTWAWHVSKEGGTDHTTGQCCG